MESWGLECTAECSLSYWNGLLHSLAADATFAGSWVSMRMGLFTDPEKIAHNISRVPRSPEYRRLRRGIETRFGGKQANVPR